ncbi:permease [Eggerthellaceae bacterium zg-1084]|uniref:cytosine permease n=1 Tax=Berryella wangjianweii TaxID=2734634 RepID=UPI001556F39F|nr:cytosine permease [Berryella wangjianweii]NPD31382.1 permease [Berryella wangjianweii]NPD32311.1 permease [Eggerthellaceae bacterium zg-997]
MGSSIAERVDQEAIFGLVPVKKSERQYGFWDTLLVTGGFAIATWCYSQGALSASYLGFWQLLIVTFAVGGIFLIVECLPVILSVRYGIDLWVYLRAVLGHNGVRILATAVILGNWFWYAVAANMFGSSIAQIMGIFGLSVPDGWVSALSIVSVVGGSAIALGGPAVIKWASRFLVTTLLVIGVIAFVLCFTIVPFDQILAYRPDLSAVNGNAREAYALAAEGMVAFSFSWSTQAMVLPRLCRTERGGYWGTVSAYGVIAPFFVFIGGVMAIVMFVVSGTLESDPTVMLALLGPQVALLSLMLVAFANIGTQAVGSYVNVLVLKAAWPKVDYRVLVGLSALYVSVLAFTGEVTANFGQFISIAAYIQGPIIGIMFVDLLIVRRLKVSLKSLYYRRGHDAYRFRGGLNPVGLAVIAITLVVALLFVYNPIYGTVESPVFHYLTGSGFTAVFAAALYLALSFVPPVRSFLLRDRDDLDIV